jgi:arginase family enzyme
MTSGSEHGPFEGTENLERLAAIPDDRHREAIERGIELGLEAAESVQDRTISTFSRGYQPAFAGINTFLKAPYLEDVRRVGEHDVAIVGAPFDGGTTFRPGARWAPQAVRQISALYDGYNLDLAVDLFEELDIVDVGDVFVIPSNIEKTFDQIDRAVDHIAASGAFPVVIGGDHSIGYPNVKAVARHVEGNVGIVHLDRHIDLAERDMDERMHTTQWFHATRIPNIPSANLVQIGIGGWAGKKAGMAVARERGTTVLTIGDVERLGIDRAAEVALEIASKGTSAIFLSLDIRRRSRQRARDRYARTGRAVVARDAALHHGRGEGGPALRDGGRRGVAPVRLGGHHVAPGLPIDPRRAGDARQRGQPRPTGHLSLTRWRGRPTVRRRTVREVLPLRRLR